MKFTTVFFEYSNNPNKIIVKNVTNNIIIIEKNEKIAIVKKLHKTYIYNAMSIKRNINIDALNLNYRDNENNKSKCNAMIEGLIQSYQQNTIRLISRKKY